ncbi:hypothetical protein J25TS5_05710 [Paenibacillus faecis]|nr:MULTISPECIES: hypothetical protein [Paenibacillus]MCA1295868.1 hypothetical protein [Paenibacillus sp. alder61]GIO83639.1 hypothetical protein J25TS5_05710 [Paenibacillus faecis]
MQESNEQKMSEMFLKRFMERPGLDQEERERIREAIQELSDLRAENERLRKTVVRLRSANTPRMSSKLKDALYE